MASQSELDAWLRFMRATEKLEMRGVFPGELFKAIEMLIDGKLALMLAPLKEIEHGVGSGQVIKSLVEVGEHLRAKDAA